MAEVAGDVFAETGLGPALCVAGTLYIEYVLTNGYATIKRLKEELTAEGYDVEEFNKVGSSRLSAAPWTTAPWIASSTKCGTISAVMSTGAGSIVDVQKVQAYWKTRA